jgi:glutamyl-tRNA synthetase
MSVRVRFAPSPTGFMHLGNARTALFNWLYARHCGGSFLLRIEDTDQERSTDAAVQVIFDSLKWLGMDWDNDPIANALGARNNQGVLFQSDRLPLYQALAHKMVDDGLAYRCYASREEIEQGKERMRLTTNQSKYDGLWRDRSPSDYPSDGRPFTIRFKTPLDGHSEFTDCALGPIRKGHQELDDFVMLRSDGWPTYQFAVVVDDHDMQITHVIRGADHVDNTHDQLNLYKALGWTPPSFTHAPRILGLSKRKGSPSVEHYRQHLGLLPEGLVNYLVRLGWSHGDQELFTTDELIAAFDLPQINNTNAQFDEAKLSWVNEQQLRRLPPSRIAEALAPYLSERGFDPAASAATANLPPDAWLSRFFDIMRPRAKNLIELADAAPYFFQDLPPYDPPSLLKLITPDTAPHLASLSSLISALSPSDWTEPNIEDIYKTYVANAGIKLGAVAQPSRFALTGRTAAPGIYEIIWLLGPQRASARLLSASQSTPPSP